MTRLLGLAKKKKLYIQYVNKYAYYLYIPQKKLIPLFVIDSE